jgi:tRNA(fMet)-specific endonuclease VapC
MAVKFALDTSAYSAFGRSDLRLKKYFTPSNDILLPIIIIGELRAGFAAGKHTSHNEGLLRRFLDTPNVQILNTTDKTTQIYADIFLSLRLSGTPIGTNDMWIAAICIENQLPLLTLDTDFTNIKNLKLIRLG